MKAALKKGVESGDLVMVKASYKLSPEAKKKLTAPPKKKAAPKKKKAVPKKVRGCGRLGTVTLHFHLSSQ